MWVRLATLADPSLIQATTLAFFQVSGYDDLFGNDPLSGYDVGVDEAGLFNVNAKIMGFFLNMVFAAIKFVAKIVATIVEWAVTLDVPAMFGEQATEIASRFHQAIGFDNPAANSLFRLALVVMFTVVFFRLVRGRTSKGLAEAGVSWAILMVYFGWIVASPTGYATVVSGTVDASQEIGGQVAAGVMGATPDLLPPECVLGDDATAEVGCAIKAGVYSVYVEVPYDILNWGHPLGSAADPTNPYQACAAARDTLIADGPWGNSDEPRSRMETAGCTAEAEYQAEPTGDRLGDAFGILLLEMFSIPAPLILAFITIYAGIRLMLRGMSAPVVVAMGIIPGQTRIGLWQWVFKTLLVMVSLANAIISLAIYLILISGTFGTVGSTNVGFNLALTLVTHIIIGVVVVLAWWRIGRAGKQHVLRLAEKMASSEGGDTDGQRVRDPGSGGLNKWEYRANALTRRARQLRRMGGRAA